MLVEDTDKRPPKMAFSEAVDTWWTSRGGSEVLTSWKRAPTTTYSASIDLKLRKASKKLLLCYNSMGAHEAVSTLLPRRPLRHYFSFHVKKVMK